MSEDRFRALKAIFRTAFAWGLVVGAVASVLITAFVFIVPGPGVESLPERVGEALFAGVGMGVRFAVAGAILGALFASMLRFGFRGRRVAELHPGKFALIGAVVAAIGIPLVYQLLNILSGGPIPWKYLIDDIPWAATVGALGGASTVWMARRGAKLASEEEVAAVGAGDPFEGSAAIRERKHVPRQ